MKAASDLAASASLQDQSLGLLLLLVLVMLTSVHLAWWLAGPTLQQGPYASGPVVQSQGLL